MTPRVQVSLILFIQLGAFGLLAQCSTKLASSLGISLGYLAEKYLDLCFSSQLGISLNSTHKNSENFIPFFSYLEVYYSLKAEIYEDIFYHFMFHQLKYLHSVVVISCNI